MARVVELIFRGNNISAIRALTEIAGASQRTAAQMDRDFYRRQRALTGAATAVGAVGRAMTAVGAGVIGVGYESGKMAVSFAAAMLRLQTQAQVSHKSLVELSKAVLNLGGPSIQFGPTELAKALYHIESVATGGAIPGIHKTANAMYLLKVAAKGAALGGSDLEQTTTALVGIMSSLHMPASKAQQAMALMNTTVGIGNMKMQDLVTAMGSGIIPAFRQYGLNAKDALAATALFADQGTAASSSARQLATALHFLAAPSARAQKILEALHKGLTLKIMKDLAKPGGLKAALTDLQQALQGLPKWERNAALSDIVPGGRGRVLLQAINNLSQYQGKLDAYGNSVKKLNAAEDAQAKSMSGKLHAAHAAINRDMTKFGQTLLPIVAEWLPRFTDLLGKIFGWVTGLSPQMKRLISIMAVGFVIGGPILVGLSRILKAWKAIRDMLYGVRTAGMAAAEGESAAAAAGGAGVGGAGAGAAEGASAAGLLSRMKLGGLAKFGLPAGILAALGYSQLSKHHQHQVNHDLSWLAHKGLAWTKPMGKALNDLLSGHPGAAAGHFGQSILKSFTTWFGGAKGGLVTPGGIRHFQSGGPSGPDNIPAWLSAGEGVLSTVGMAGLGNAGLSHLNAGGDISGLLGGMHIAASPVNVILDGRVIAQAVVRYSLQRGARGPSSLSGGSLMVGTSTAVQR